MNVQIFIAVDQMECMLIFLFLNLHVLSPWSYQNFKNNANAVYFIDFQNCLLYISHKTQGGLMRHNYKLQIREK
jgi:hypothetical protein